MNTTEEQHLQQLLTQLESVPRSQLRQKFMAYFEQQSTAQVCKLEEFAIYYLAALRQNTEVYFRSSEGATPKCQTPVRQANPLNTTLQITPDSHALNANESQQYNHSSFNVSTASVLSQSVASTPARGRRSIGQLCSTPQSSDRANRSSGSSSFRLGDFIVTTPTQRSKKKPASIQSTTTPQENIVVKPKRRVLPMTISRNVSASSFGTGTSSFSNDNNLLQLSHSVEQVDRSQCVALDVEARKSLLLYKQEIKSEASVATAMDRRQCIVEAEEENVAVAEMLEPIDFRNIRNSNQLQLLAAIYAQLIDLNLVPNVLNELCYIMQLLNIREHSVRSALEPESSLAALTQRDNCVYFAVQVMEYQQSLLLQLDRKSLTVLLQNERTTLLPKLLQEQLELACQRKQHQAASVLDCDSKQNVYYQHDKDSRDNFPTQHEFSAFKTQRDLFYKAFKHWEDNHLNRAFNFSSEILPTIREIFRQSEHIINMAHFAKLFVSQLLISASEATESPEELGLKLDQLRLNQLAQRLVTSNSSVEDPFPRTQAYFRDFVNECGSVAFLAQLKLALYAQLLRLNDSTFELVQLHFGISGRDEGDALNQQDETAQQALEGPYIVRAAVLASMLTLAKFLGYVTALPYSCQTAVLNSTAISDVSLQQLHLRSLFQPDFDLYALLERAMCQGKLLITLPWLVQYLIMLDSITIQLSNNNAALEFIYSLYATTGVQSQELQPCALFILRSCIGWLLDAQPSLITNYYRYRAQRGTTVSSASLVVEQCLNNLCLNKMELQGASPPLLEHLLPVACPFLPEFRVAIGTSNQSQSTSRSGRFRYITTRLEQFSPAPAHIVEKKTSSLSCRTQTLTMPEQQQRKLIDAFLHSQNASMRRLVEFVTERSFKCVVKDAQQRILIPSKAAADAQVNAIRATQQQEVYRELKRIYSQARAEAYNDWQAQVPAMLEQRIQLSLDALLPRTTNAVVHRTCVQLIRIQAQQQLQQWFESSVLQSNFYYNDLQDVANKVCRANKLPSSMFISSSASNELRLSSDGEVCLSDLLYSLQKWLHCVSPRAERLPSQS